MTCHRDPLSDPLCQHEFPDTSLYAVAALPDRTRCVSHQDDGQPDALITGGGLDAGVPVLVGGTR